MKKITEQQLIESARALKEKLTEDDPSAWDKFRNHPLSATWQSLPFTQGEKHFSDPNHTEGSEIDSDILLDVLSNQFNMAGYAGEGAIKHMGRWYTDQSKDEIKDKKMIGALELIAKVQNAGGDINAMKKAVMVDAHYQGNTLTDPKKVATDAIKKTQSSAQAAPPVPVPPVPPVPVPPPVPPQSSAQAGVKPYDDAAKEARYQAWLKAQGGK